MNRKFGTVILLATLGACASDGVEVLPAESNDIGVAQVEISHVFGGDDTLVVRALDVRGSEVVAARLRTGVVSYSPEPDAVPAQSSYGRELLLAMDGFVHPAIVNPSLHQMTLPPEIVDEPKLRSFLRIPTVASALAASGIGFTSSPAGADTPYLLGGGGTTCAGNKFPNNVANPKQCCQETGGQTTHVLGGTGTTLARRIYYPFACRFADQTTGCVDTQCVIGPCKGFKAWSHPQGKVWHPFSGDGYYSNTCAWDDLAGNYWPYPWTAEPTWAGTTATCTCTGCLANGTPTPIGCAN